MDTVKLLAKQKSERPEVCGFGALGNHHTREGVSGRSEICPGLPAPSTLGEYAEELTPYPGDFERQDGPEHYLSSELAALLDWPYSPSLREGGAM